MSEHGTTRRYNAGGCRCDDCRTANSRYRLERGFDTLYKRKRYAERTEINGRLVHPNPYKGHGTYVAYNNCGCRCDPCREAARKHQREYRARNPEGNR